MNGRAILIEEGSFWSRLVYYRAMPRNITGVAWRRQASRTLLGYCRYARRGNAFCPDV